MTNKYKSIIGCVTFFVGVLLIVLSTSFTIAVLLILTGVIFNLNVLIEKRSNFLTVSIILTALTILGWVLINTFVVSNHVKQTTNNIENVKHE